MVPMLTCGLVRSNLAFATWCPSLDSASYAVAASCCAGLFAVGLRDDLLRDVRGNLGVGVELHAVARPALRPRPQVADVAEHLRQRDQRSDDACTAAFLHGLDLATAGVEIADHVTHEVLGGRDLDGH